MSEQTDNAFRHGDAMAHTVRDSLLAAAEASGDQRAFWRAFATAMTGAVAAQCGGLYAGELLDALAAIARSQHVAGAPAIPMQQKH